MMVIGMQMKKYVHILRAVMWSKGQVRHAS